MTKGWTPRVRASVFALLAGTALGVLAPAYAAAQTAPTRPEAAPDVPPGQAQGQASTTNTPEDAAEDRQDADTGPLADIVVTATKRVESVQTVPISVTALGVEQIRDRGLQSLQDISGAVPNFQWPRAFTPAQADISIRGIYTYVSQGQIGLEPGFAVYLDGAYLGRPGSADLDLGDIERVEVLRGPQGTLFGKNAIAGVLNVVTKKPDNEFGGSLFAEGGRFNLFRVRGALNVPLVPDVLAARISVGVVRRDGYITNQFTGDDDVNNINQGSGRLQIGWTPEDGTRVDFSADILKSKSDFARGLVTPIDRLNSTPFDIINLDFPEFSRKDNKGGVLTIERAVGDSGYQLTSITSYRDDADDLRLDVDGQTANGNHVTQTTRQRQWTQELRLASPSADWGNFVAGVFFLNQKADLDRNSFNGTAAAAAIRNTNLIQRQDVDTRSAAGFLNVAVDLTDQLEVFGGARYTWEKKTFRVRNTCVPVTLCPLIAPGTVSGAVYDSPVDLDNENISWTGGVRYTPATDIMAYASVSRGFKGASFNDVANPAFNFSQGNLFANQETATNYEVGLKSRLLDRRLTANVAAFWLDYKDLQVRNFCPTCGVQGINLFSNAAAVTAKGFEVELAAVPVDGLTLTANGGYTDARFDTYRGLSDPRPVALGGRGTNVDASGNVLPNAPKWTVNLSAQYDYDVSPNGTAIARIDYAYASERFSAFSGAINGEDTRIEPRNIVNTRIGYRNSEGRWGAFFWTRNLTNQRRYDLKYIHNFVTLGYFLSWLEPRTYGVSLEAAF